MGMLSEEPTQQPQAKPPVESAQPEQQTGGQPDIEAMKQQGIKILYDDRFDKLMNMFKKNGAERFPTSMATAINTVIDELEKNGPLPVEAVTEVGMELFTVLFTDIVDSGEIPGITPEMAQKALNKTITMYAQNHPETVSKEDLAMLSQEIQNQAGALTQQSGDQAMPSEGVGQMGAAQAAPEPGAQQEVM